MKAKGTRVSRRTALLAGASALGGIAAVSDLGLSRSGHGLFDISEAKTTSVTPADVAAIKSAMGKDATIEDDGTLHFSLGRLDLDVSNEHIKLDPSNALSVEAWFFRMDGMDMMMGEIPLRETELNGTISRLFAGGITLTAVHNHRIFLSPHVIWIHCSAMGSGPALARAFRDSWPAALKTDSGKQKPETTPLHPHQLATILGGKALVNSGGVVEVDVPRGDTIRMGGTAMPPSAGISHEIYFQPTGGNTAMVTVELPLIGSEVNPVARTLRAGGFKLTALHNHMIGEQPRVFFLHGAATGDATVLATVARQALNHASTQGGRG